MWRCGCLVVYLISLICLMQIKSLCLKSLLLRGSYILLVFYAQYWWNWIFSVAAWEWSVHYCWRLFLRGERNFLKICIITLWHELPFPFNFNKFTTYPLKHLWEGLWFGRVTGIYGHTRGLLPVLKNHIGPFNDWLPEDVFVDFLERFCLWLIDYPLCNFTFFESFSSFTRSRLTACFCCFHWKWYLGP